MIYRMFLHTDDFALWMTAWVWAYVGGLVESLSLQQCHHRRILQAYRSNVTTEGFSRPTAAMSPQNDSPSLPQQCHHQNDSPSLPQQCHHQNDSPSLPQQCHHRMILQAYRSNVTTTMILQAYHSNVTTK